MISALARRQAVADSFAAFRLVLGNLDLVREALATTAEVDDEVLRTELADMGTRVYALRARLDALASRQSKLDDAERLGEIGGRSPG